MIKDTEPLSSIEAIDLVKKSEKANNDLASFVKNFVKMDLKKVRELKGKLEELNLMKLNKEQIVKIIDFLPENSEDLNKIFTDVSLDENETKSVLETIKEFK